VRATHGRYIYVIIDEACRRCENSSFQDVRPQDASVDFIPSASTIPSTRYMDMKPDKLVVSSTTIEQLLYITRYILHIGCVDVPQAPLVASGPSNKMPSCPASASA
jgi:hypothetical protein